MTDRQASPFGEQLRRLREAAGLTQEELAERAGLSRDAIGTLERGLRRHPHPETVRALAEALGLEDRETAAFRAAVPKRPESSPLPTSDPGRAGLPRPLTRLVGRQLEIADVRRLLTADQARLVTLTGPGGVGKTRLAIELAENLEPAFPDGILFVPLATVLDPALVPPTIAMALGMPDTSGESLAEQSAHLLGDRRILLVLDNFEQVIDAAPSVAALLAACPGLAVLVTSRSPLRLNGEQEYPVHPLKLPSATRQTAGQDLAAYDAVALFAERAQAANPSFSLTERNAAAVTMICQRLGGLPLALELAAAQARFLGPSELLARLDQALQAEGARDLPARHRSLRATLDWSHRLLSEPERALLRRLAAFSGGFTLEAAEAVSQEGAESGGQVVGRLGALVEQSLVTVTHDPQGTRYGMLEPIRQYALERLEESDESAETHRCHANYYLVLAERGATELEGRSDQVAWLERLEQEHDNLRAALAWSEIDPARAGTALRIASALWRFWEVRGHTGEGSRWLAGALARSEGLDPALRANALSAAGNLARDRADHDQATVYHEQALELRRQLGDRRGIARSLNNLGVIARDRGDAEQTIRLCHESLVLLRADGDQHGAAIALISLGAAASQQGDHVQGRSYYEESLALFRKAGDRWHTAWVQTYLAQLLIRQGDFVLAHGIAGESLELHRAANDAWGIAMALGVLGRIAQVDGDLAAAAGQFAEGLRWLAEAGIERAIPECLEDLAGVALAKGDPELGARLGGAGEALRELVGVTRSAGGLVDLAGLRSGPQAAAWAMGRALSREQVITEALTLADGIARVQRPEAVQDQAEPSVDFC